VSECKAASVAQWLSIGFSRGRVGFDITARPPLDVVKVSTAFVITCGSGWTFFFFNVFLRTIKLRSRLTILSNLNSVGC